MADRDFLHRAVQAEDELAQARERIADLETRLRGVLGSDIDSYRDLAGRLKLTEDLLVRVVTWLERPDLDYLAEIMPEGLLVQLRAQLKVARGLPSQFGPVLTEAERKRLAATGLSMPPMVKLSKAPNTNPLGRSIPTVRP